MNRSKLVRNLKRGDRVRIVDVDGKRDAIVTVLSVQERSRGHMTGKRQWEVCAEYPWWFGCTGIMGYVDTRIDVL